jgi:aryl-alcohol dehydrogenase-like predicted oxidoreductase
MNSKLILGTVQFGLNYGINNIVGKPSKKNIKSILDSAYNNGIQLLDTAEAYGDSQNKIGEYHNNSTNKFNVITKFSSNAEGFSLNIIERVHNNLKILDVDKLYCYMFHSFDDFENHFENYRKELRLLKKNGIIDNIGVSVYTNNELESVLKFDEISLVQLPFNLLDNDNKRGDILKKAKVKGIEIHTRSVFLQGLFFKKISELGDKIKPLEPYLRLLNDLCDKDYKINDLALNYVCNRKNIDRVLIGVDNVFQLKANIVSEKRNIQKEIFKKIEAIDVKEIELLNPSNW